MKLSINGIKEQEAWKKAGIALPGYDVEAASENRCAPACGNSPGRTLRGNRRISAVRAGCCPVRSSPNNSSARVSGR